ncbi:MAG: exodeoxyribonuclease V subunit beta [Thalassotalea sp.]
MSKDMTTSTESVTTSANIAQPLLVENIPLFGKHLIEASAGTGKTYNITRIYLRMLLERKLSVEQILVMTFTKDATQELKGRIDNTLREAISHWDTLILAEPFYQQLAARITKNEAMLLLKRALLFLDEAAIYTIHGFCQRVLTEHAFGTKTNFAATLETDLSEMVLQATQDWYRQLAVEQVELFLLLESFWSTPEKFLAAFNKAIYQHSALDVLAEENIEADFCLVVESAINSLQLNESLIYQALIDTQKAAKQTERIAELTELKAWLTTVLSQPCLREAGKPVQEQPLPMPTKFFSGVRYARSVHKDALLLAFEPLKQVKEAIAKLAKNLNRAKAFTVVRSGVYQIRANLAEQKLQHNVLGFDDLILHLATSLSENSALAKQVQQTFPVALVDEFQDTDPAQFTILEALYSEDKKADDKNSAPNYSDFDNGKLSRALFMIGDPKQAIYGFRGGDVFAYLSARQQCQQQWLMDTNWRSSPNMIDGYNRLFYGDILPSDDVIAAHTVTDKVFGYQIPYLPVKASTKAKTELQANDQYSALQFVHFAHESGDEQQKVPQNFRPQLANWCANEIHRLLFEDNVQALQAQDIAILVRDGTEAKEIKLALASKGLASVYLSNRNNLFDADEAKQLLVLLKGILYCENERLYSAAVASPLLKYSAHAFYQLQQDEFAWQTLKFTFEALKSHWLSKSFMSMALTLMHDHFIVEEEHQDRVLTNVLHLFELLQIASQRHHQPHELIFWLEQHISGQSSLTETELRLDSDEDLIKIVTQHGSKGLEYPVVFIPFVARYKNPLKLGLQNVNLIEYHNEQGDLRISLDASMAAKEKMVAENHAETIRLLYVAITRAEQRCYLLTTNFDNAHLSPIGATLKASLGELEAGLKQLADDNAGIGFSRVLEEELDFFSQEPLADPSDSSKVMAGGDADHKLNQLSRDNLAAAKFTSKIERDWWLSSFSALTRNAHHSGISTPDRDYDELSEKEDFSHLIRFSMKKGAQTGNFLHDIFERLDFITPNWSEVVGRGLARYQYIIDGFSDTELTHWLQEVIDTPLIFTDVAEVADVVNSVEINPASGNISLSSLTGAKTLREAEFYFPMNNAQMKTLGNLLNDHRNFIYTKSAQNSTSDNLGNRQSNHINLPLYRQLKGMMHGFIDLLFEAEGKYYVCDYKSSYLGDDFSDYQHQNLLTNIEDNYYDLQYLIYSLALHRYLKSNLENYQFERDFGGVFYLYLRGMKKNHHYQNSDGSICSSGVYHSEISKTLIEQLDSLFAGERSDDVSTNVTNKKPLDNRSA